MQKMTRLKRPITLEFCDGAATITILKIERGILGAAKEVAAGERTELKTAWVEFRATGDLGRYRQVRDLADCHCQGTDCVSARILLDMLGHLVKRIRERPPTRDHARVSSSWPYANISDKLSTPNSRPVNYN